MLSPPNGRQNGDTNGQMTQRERIIYGLQTAEDTARESLLHGGVVTTRKAKSLWTHFKVPPLCLPSPLLAHRHCFLNLDS